MNRVIFFFHLQTEVDQKSEPAQLEIAQLLDPMQGRWQKCMNGKEGVELSYPLLMQNITQNSTLELPTETTPKVEFLVCFLCYGGCNP